jgi:Fe-Mn family superoxide dismutase
MAFELPELPYPADSLEPHIDSKTMNIHHGKHHAGYTSKLNVAVEGTPNDNKSIEEILSTLDMSNNALRNNGGGFFNHCLFWEILSPNKSEMSEGLRSAINDSFGSFNSFKDSFSVAASSQFGSGWAWLCKHPDGSLEVCSTPNQDNPLMPEIGSGGVPILCLDVWEHAYYLNYQNRRPDYITNFFEIINWEKVSELYASS